MATRYRPVDRGRQFLLPPDMSEWLPGHHLVWVIEALVADLETSALTKRRRRATTTSRAGQPGYDLRRSSPLRPTQGLLPRDLRARLQDGAFEDAGGQQQRQDCGHGEDEEGDQRFPPFDRAEEDAHRDRDRRGERDVGQHRHHRLVGREEDDRHIGQEDEHHDRAGRRPQILRPGDHRRGRGVEGRDHDEADDEERNEPGDRFRDLAEDQVVSADGGPDEDGQRGQPDLREGEDRTRQDLAEHQHLRRGGREQDLDDP